MTRYRTIEIDGRELFYREGGDPEATTLLLLHGFPSSSAQYDELMKRLSGRYHVIAPDYPGFGRSPVLPGATTFDRLGGPQGPVSVPHTLARFQLEIVG